MVAVPPPDPQYSFSCEACGREIVGMAGHWRCPYCGHNNPHLGRRRYGGAHCLVFTPDEMVGPAFTQRAEGRQLRRDEDGRVAVEE